MSFKMIFALAFFASVANALRIHSLLTNLYTGSAAVGTPLTYARSAVGTTQENVVRSFDGTVSQYSKAVDTPFSSVRKSDTRINNNVYTPASAAAAPVHAVHYAHAAAPTVYAHAAPVLGAKAAIAYSPAATVTHVTFDGFGAHYVY